MIEAISRTVGGFKNFPNKSFPIDADGLHDMQLNEKLLSILGNIGGNRYILSGCDAPNSYSGYVFLATIDNPEGELLYLEPGTLGTTVYLKKTPVSITAEGYDYNNAYIKRTLAWGDDTESWAWDIFKRIETNAQLSAKVLALQTALAGIVPEAVGSMKFWAGTVENKPLNWLECGGQELLIADYPELFAVIGTTYGAPSQVSFRLPNTKGRVPVAYNVDDADFRPIGKTNNYNTKTHTLTTAEMPAHSHRVNGQDNNSPPNGSPTELGNTENWSNSGAIRTTSSDGGGMAHNNLQPYMALPFIIKVK